MWYDQSVRTLRVSGGGVQHGDSLILRLMMSEENRWNDHRAYDRLNARPISGRKVYVALHNIYSS